MHEKADHKIKDVNPQSAPSGTGCADCLANGQWWFHLRRCAECGHIGCCDSSPNQHARAHYHKTKHSVIASFEPGEDWLYSFATDELIDGPELSDPRWHPRNQPTPGPAGKVPANWQLLLH